MRNSRYVRWYSRIAFAFYFRYNLYVICIGNDSVLNGKRLVSRASFASLRVACSTGLWRLRRLGPSGLVSVDQRFHARKPCVTYGPSGLEKDLPDQAWRPCHGPTVLWLDESKLRPYGPIAWVELGFFLLVPCVLHTICTGIHEIPSIDSGPNQCGLYADSMQIAPKYARNIRAMSRVEPKKVKLIFRSILPKSWKKCNSFFEKS